MLAESALHAFGTRQRHSSPSADGEIPCLNGAFTRAVAIFRAIVHCFLPFKQCCELTKQPGGLFWGRGRFVRKSVPYYLSSLFKSADLIGTKVIIEVFLQSEPPIMGGSQFAEKSNRKLCNNIFQRLYRS